MSYATIISICPAEVNVTLPHTTPPRITIPPAEVGKPILAVFSDGEERQFIGGEVNKKDPWVKYPVIALDLVKGIVNSYKMSATFIEPNALPGIFAVSGKPDGITPGNHNYTIVLNNGNESVIDKFIGQFTAEYNKIKTQQDNWFKRLVQVADKSFAKNSNYAEISDLQRYAAKRMNIERPWNKEIKPEDFKKCPFCQSFVDPAAIVCIHCQNIVNQEEYKKLNAWREKESLAGKLGTNNA